MSLRPFKFEVDNTGVNPDNLVMLEPHALPASGVRFIVTDNGPFYTNSLAIYDQATGQKLAPRTQYLAIQLEEEATQESGKEVCSIIIITDASVSANVNVTYQAYGGWMSYSVTAIKDMIEALDLDHRVIHWADIVGKPDRYPPAPHLHPLSDIYGWHKLFPSLNAIRDAILTSDQAVLDAIRSGFAAEIARLEAMIASNGSTLTNHINNFNNPHKVTLAQLGGYTAQEINQILLGYLKIDGTAVNSLKLEGRSFTQTRNEIVGSIQNTELTRGYFPKGNIGENFNSSDQSMVLTTTGWKGFKAHETTYGRTLAELGGYSTAQVDSLIAGRLPINGTAQNSLKLENRSFAQVRADIVSSIQNTELTRGIIPKANVGENFNASDQSMVLTTTGWKAFKAHETSFGRNITELGGYTTTEVNNLVNGRLPVNGTAANSNLLQGNNVSQILSAAYNAIGSMGKRNVFFSAGDPGGADGAIGDIWMKYV